MMTTQEYMSNLQAYVELRIKLVYEKYDLIL